MFGRWIKLSFSKKRVLSTFIDKQAIIKSHDVQLSAIYLFLGKRHEQ